MNIIEDLLAEIEKKRAEKSVEMAEYAAKKIIDKIPSLIPSLIRYSINKFPKTISDETAEIIVEYGWKNMSKEKQKKFLLKKIEEKI